MFCALDVDQDGFLCKDEYRAFLVFVGLWGSGYSVEGWNSGNKWPEEVALLGCDSAGRGVSRAGFTLLYTKYRAVNLNADAKARF